MLNTIQGALFEQFDTINKDRIAIEYLGEELSYTQLERKSNIVANIIIEQGIEKGSLICVLTTDKMELIIVLVGILKAGCVFVPMEPTYPLKRLQMMLSSTATNFMFVGRGIPKELVESLKANHQSLECEWIDESTYAACEGNERRPEVVYDPEDMIYIYFTSGTSGKPKAISGRNKSLLHFVKWEIETFNIDNTTRVSQLTSQCHDPYLRDIFVPLCAGGTVSIADNMGTILTPSKLISWLEESKVNLIHCTPSVFRIMSSGQLTSSRLPLLKFILLAGEKININDLIQWFDIFAERIQLVNMYGPTETTLAKMCYMINPSDVTRKSIPIGKSIRGGKVIILDKYMGLCDQGEVGEIFIRTPYRSHGYYNDPALTKEKFIPNPFNSNPDDLIYKTGDLGRLLDDGNIEFIGRVDREIKIRGYRVHLTEIENELLKYPGIKECVVCFNDDLILVQQDDINTGGYLAAYVVVSEEVTEMQLREYLMAALPEYMVPSYLVFLESIPSNSNGKVDYNHLPDPKKMTRKSYTKPTDAVEEKLSIIWCEILGISEVGTDESFMQIGGNSLSIMSLISKVFQHFKIEMPLEVVFQDPTIQGVGRFISDRLADEVDEKLVESIDITNNNNVIRNVIEKEIINDHSGEACHKKIADITSFNDIYYKNCFYNAFFPVVNYFGKDILTILVNDTIVYTYQERTEGVHFGIDFISAMNADALMESMGISYNTASISTDIIDQVVNAINENRPVILGIDLYYETNRPEFFGKNNWAHNLLVYGYDHANQLMTVLEHNDINSLAYKEESVSYKDIFNGYNSYIANFPNMNNLPAYLEFFPTTNEQKGSNQENSIIFKQNMIANREEIYGSLEQILKISEYFKVTTSSEELLRKKIDNLMLGINSIVNAKVAERYKVRSLFHGEGEIHNLINKIIGNWILVRSVCEKFRLSNRYNSVSFQKSAKLLEQLYDLENLYTEKIFGKCLFQEIDL